MDTENQDDLSPGWDAITEAIEKLYPGQEPKHYGTPRSYILGGGNPLPGISAYKRLDPIPHWHFVTYGFSELFQKESEDMEVSGFGFELTFRLRADIDNDEPPAWALNMLQNIARYVFDSGNVFRAGHWMNANGPIAIDTTTKLCSIGFMTDPELPAISTPHGSVEFLQIIGLTADEGMAAKKSDTKTLLQALLPAMPLWVTDLDRHSLLEDPEIRQKIESVTAQKGSSTGLLFTDVLEFKTQKKFFRKPVVTIVMGAEQVDELTMFLPLRLPFNRDFEIRGKDQRAIFEAGSANDIRQDDDTLEVFLAPETLNEIASLLKPVRGSYAIPSFPGLTFEIKPTEITDPQGNVTEVIG